MTDTHLLVKFHSGQGLGNQLWNYAAVKSICEEFNYKFSIINKEDFKGNDFLEIFDSHPFDIVKNKISERQIPIFNEVLAYEKDFDEHLLIYDERVSKLNGLHLMSGCFQSEKYFYNKIFILKKFIKIKTNFNNRFFF